MKTEKQIGPHRGESEVTEVKILKAEADSAATKKQGIFGPTIIKNQSFKKLWTAHAFSQLSGYTLIFLVIGKTFEVTTSNIASGMLWISFTIPTLLLSPFIGSLVDLWNKQRILILTNFLHWFIIYGFAISFSINKPYLAYPLLFLYAAIGTVNDPAEMAKILDLRGFAVPLQAIRL